MDTEGKTNKVGSIIRTMEQDYRAGNTNVSKYVSFDMLETLNKIDAYHWSKHTTGETDSLGREKPFPNIVIPAENIWYRATDIDRGKIKIKATKTKNVINAFLANIHIQDWMRRENFGLFLNEWGRTLSRYGSALLKFVEKDGELHRMVVPWQSIICDTVDFENNPVIEVLDLTEAKLRENTEYDEKMIDALCDAKTSRKLLDGTEKDNKSEYIRVYEIHGKFPRSYITAGTKQYKESDDDDYVEQMHAMSFVVRTDEKTGDTYYEDYTLAKGIENWPYLLTHLIKEEGRTLGIGPVESLFEAQWMQNHTAKAIKDQLDLASKLIFQTSDGTFVGQNVISAIETGDILIHKQSEPITQVANNSHDITSLQNFSTQWKVLGNEITGISESMLGQTAPSGTAWRQVEALLQESHGLFQLMRQNKGLYIEEMMRKFVIPFVKKQMDTSEEVSATLENHEIRKLDSMYITNKAAELVNKETFKRAMNGIPTSPEDQASMLLSAQSNLAQGLSNQGNQRFFVPSEISTLTWKEQFKDMEWDLEVDVTGENYDSDDMTTLNTMFMALAKNPNILQDPNVRMLWDKILMRTGAVSPIEIGQTPSPLSLTSMPSPVPTLPAPIK